MALAFWKSINRAQKPILSLTGNGSPIRLPLLGENGLLALPASSRPWHPHTLPHLSVFGGGTVGSSRWSSGTGGGTARVWAEVQEGPVELFMQGRLKFQDGGAGGKVPLVLIQPTQGAGFAPQHHRKLDVVVYTCNPSTTEVQDHHSCYTVK